MATIYCFSSTGNSLYVSKTVAEKIGAECRSMSQPPDICTDSVIGFVFPAYFWGLPRLVEGFVSSLVIENKNAYLFAIVTYGGIIHGVSGVLDRLLRRKGISLQYSTKIKSVENYIPVYQINDTEALHRSVDKNIEKISKDITRRAQNRTEACTVANSLIHSFSPGKRGDCDKRFLVSPGCTGCGICEGVCPVANIAIKDGKPTFSHHCEHCLACIHACPVSAIEWKKATKGKKRYRNPHIGLRELMAFSGKKGREC